MTIKGGAQVGTACVIVLCEGFIRIVPDGGGEGAASRRSLSRIHILVADEGVLAEIAAGPHLDEDHRHLTRVFQAVDSDNHDILQPDADEFQAVGL